MRKPARQGSKLAGKGTYLNVNDRRLQVQLMQEAKIAPVFLLIWAIFAFAGFVSALSFAFGETAEPADSASPTTPPVSGGKLRGSDFFALENDFPAQKLPHLHRTRGDFAGFPNRPNRPVLILKT